jgi:hypothetical protein
MCHCELPRVFNDVVRTSRKTRRCDECYRDIVRGEAYHAISGLWDGSWSFYSVCMFCEALRDVIQRGDLDNCVAFGQMRLELEDWDLGEEDEAMMDAMFPFRIEERETRRKRLEAMMKAISS